LLSKWLWKLIFQNFQIGVPDFIIPLNEVQSINSFAEKGFNFTLKTINHGKFYITVPNLAQFTIENDFYSNGSWETTIKEVNLNRFIIRPSIIFCLNWIFSRLSQLTPLSYKTKAFFVNSKQKILKMRIFLKKIKVHFTSSYSELTLKLFKYRCEVQYIVRKNNWSWSIWESLRRHWSWKWEKRYLHICR